MNVIFSLMLLIIAPLTPLGSYQDQTKPDSSVPIKDLRNAPAEVVLENKTLRLTAYAGRDFMPILRRADGSRLMVVLKLTAADKTRLPIGVRLDRAWVLFGEEIWEVSDLRNRIPRQDHAE